MDFLDKLKKENDYLQTMKKHGLVDGKQTLSVDLDPKTEEHGFKVENMAQEQTPASPAPEVQEAAEIKTGDNLNDQEFSELKTNFEKMAKFIMEFQKIKNEEIRTLHDKIEHMNTIIATMESKLKNMSSGMSSSSNSQTQAPASSGPKVTQPQSRSGNLTPDSVDLGSFFYAGK